MNRRSRWLKFQITQAIIMILLAVFLLIRSHDGHGVYQTFEFKMISLGIWLLFCAGLLAVEWLVYWLMKSYFRMNRRI